MTQIEIVDPVQAELLVPAAALWAEAERARVGDRHDERYIEDQQAGFIDTMDRADAWSAIAMSGARVVGVVGGFPATEPGDAYLAYVVVDPGFGRTGVGRRLLEAAARRVRELGATRLRLTVHETNTPARRFYESSGWQLTGRTEQTPIDDELLVEYRFDL